jgi:hypothetical protein
MRMQISGTASEVSHLFQKMNAGEKVNLSVETNGAIPVVDAEVLNGNGKRHLSAKARRAISDAQRARWAKQKRSK